MILSFIFLKYRKEIPNELLILPWKYYNWVRYDYSTLKGASGLLITILQK